MGLPHVHTPADGGMICSPFLGRAKLGEVLQVLGCLVRIKGKTLVDRHRWRVVDLQQPRLPLAVHHDVEAEHLARPHRAIFRAVFVPARVRQGRRVECACGTDEVYKEPVEFLWIEVGKLLYELLQGHRQRSLGRVRVDVEHLLHGDPAVLEQLAALIQGVVRQMPQALVQVLRRGRLVSLRAEAREPFSAEEDAGRAPGPTADEGDIDPEIELEALDQQRLRQILLRHSRLVALATHLDIEVPWVLTKKNAIALGAVLGLDDHCLGLAPWVHHGLLHLRLLLRQQPRQGVEVEGTIIHDILAE
mmetsp:Transcript_19537/g.54602  ORF Transcript_19537/g.54602 Transcript_19537/m.54602 type:complete len:304 (-) Transcript_19537:553-1464(-)